MSNRVSRAVALSAGLIAAGTALHAGPAAAGKEEDAFAKAGYSLCDAKLMAIYWGGADVEDTVHEAGDKLINGYKNQVDEAVTEGRKRNGGNLALCPAKDFYTKEEIAAFAKYWDMGEKAAVRDISEKLINGDKESVDLAIKEILAKG